MLYDQAPESAIASQGRFGAIALKHTDSYLGFVSKNISRAHRWFGRQIEMEENQWRQVDGNGCERVIARARYVPGRDDAAQVSHGPTHNSSVRP